MDCERAQGLLSGFLDGSLPNGDRAGVNAHLKECPPCKAAKEGLEETLLLLRSLPPVPAPPELLEGVRRGIAREEPPARPLWKKLFLPAHVKIPLEAAAAVLLFFLVYGAQKEQPAKPQFQPPAATMEASPAGGLREPPREEARAAPEPPRSRSGKKESAVPSAAASGEAEAGRTAGDRRIAASPPETASARRDPRAMPEKSSSPPSQPFLPLVPAQRVSTFGERIESPEAPGEKEAGSAIPRMFAAPLQRPMRPVPFDRDVTVEVSAGERPGLESRISAVVLRLGGSVQDRQAFGGVAQEGADEALLVHLPAVAEKPFLAELGKLGTLPGEEGIGGPELPLEPAPAAVAYIVRIRVR
jgi:hypothetical protein